jgi:RNA:NAD 2'-phosphotransferase (TPT1/KptA family)
MCTGTEGIYHMRKGIYHMSAGIYHMRKGMYHMSAGIYHMRKGKYHMSAGIYHTCTGAIAGPGTSISLLYDTAGPGGS